MGRLRRRFRMCWHGSALVRPAIAFAAAIFVMTGPAEAITLSRVDNMIHISGPIEIGDGKRLSAFIESEKARLKPTLSEGDSFEWKVSLDSTGGSLSDGIEIGRLFHTHQFETLIERGKSCYSACAIAFLGGVRQYATGIGPWREMQPGATLGFHGYRSSGKEVVLLNEAFDQARALNGLILEYAAQIKQVDLGFLSELLNVPAEEMRLIKTPSQLKKLGIWLADPPKRPADAGYNVCLAAINKIRPSLDGFLDDDRLGRNVRRLRTPAELLASLIADRYASDFATDRPKRAALTKMPVSAAIDLITGSHVDPDYVQFPVERYDLGRGSGFYYDQCYVLFGGDQPGAQTQSIVLSNSGSSVYTFHAALDSHPPDKPLW